MNLRVVIKLIALLLLVACVMHGVLFDISIYHGMVLHPLVIIACLLMLVNWNMPKVASANVRSKG